MPRFQSAFSHLLPILDNTDYKPTPISNFTTLNVNNNDLHTTFLDNLLSEDNRFILASDDPIFPTSSPTSEPIIPLKLRRTLSEVWSWMLLIPFYLLYHRWTTWSDGGLFVVDDVTTSSGKRVVAFSSDASLAILNQAHKVIFIDGTF